MGTFHVTEALIQRQLENEEKVIDRGIEKYRKALVKAENQGHAADTMPGRWLTSYMVEPIAGKIRGHITEYNDSGRPGPCAIAVPILNALKADVCAYIALRTVMNSVLDAKGMAEKSGVQGRIARELIEELQFNYMAVEDTQAYKYWTREIDRAPNRKTKDRCRDRLKKNYSDIPGYDSDEEVLAVTAAAEILIRFTTEATGIATIEKRTIKRGSRTMTPDFLILTPGFRERFKVMNGKAETLWPKFEPMIVPPRPWTGAFGGGFIGKLGKRTKLVRTGNRSYLEDIHNNIHKMDRVLKALNAIQATPWRINRRLYEVMQEAFGTRAHAYGLPPSDPLPEPVRPDDIKTNKESAKQFVNELKAVQRLEVKRQSRWLAVHNMLEMAEKFVDEDAIWFAHNLDWRGRVYPLSSYLSPQGEELSQALLEFANGLALETDEAVEWLAIHGAGCWGNDKVSFADRVEWVRENEEHIRGSAEAPLDYTWWTQADKPWMFLAWCFDWVGYLDIGKAHVSRLPVAMDGSCNGLQNFAAMLRHEETARAVNLAPSDRPNDIYQQVADKVKPMVAAIATCDPRTDEEILTEAEQRTVLEYADKDKTEISKEERAKTAALWDVLSARWIQDHITRKLVKRPVMTYPYSVTKYGMREQLVETLLEMHGDGVGNYPIKHVGKVAGMLKTAVFEAIQETVVAAAQAMKWLRAAAKVVAKGNLPVLWVSPIGMRVVQNYWEAITAELCLRSRRQNIRIHAKLYASTELTNHPIVKVSKQASGVAPNFVHSCDASHLMFTVNACLDGGVSDFHMIHDSYGTHARNAMILTKSLREQFVQMYSGNVLENFYQQLKEQTEEKREEEIPVPPKQSMFDLSAVLKSKYFFA